MDARKWKQRVIDYYLNASGANVFIPADFLAWLKDRPGHECYPIFYGMTDEAAAQAHREDMVRRWVSGLRIVVRTVDAEAQAIGPIVVREYPLPALHSPVDGRRARGGYLPTDGDDPAHLAEIARQGASSLAGWLARYGGAAALLGVDTAPVDAIRAALAAAADQADARGAAA